MKAKWIWYPGEFELYHSLQVHTRREHFGMCRPAFWDIPSLYPLVEFEKTFTADKDGSFVCLAKGDGLVLLDGDAYYALGTKIPVKKGEHCVSVKIKNDRGLPSIFVEGDVLCSDGSWTTTHGCTEPLSAGCVPALLHAEDDPHIFPFSYEPITPVSEEACEEGILFDFGKETFAKLVLERLDPNDALCVCYGESREEALSEPAYPFCVVFEHLTGKCEATLRARAFRYIFLRGCTAKDVRVSALYEYLPLTVGGAFSCNDARVEKIWQVCAYTFHLCAREFFFDGIKRDRWVWSGDARQSFMINDYIFADRELCKRTILSLLPKDRVFQHVNTINDYSTLLIISAWEYYFSFADAEFIKFIYPRFCRLYDFITSRLDADGFVVERTGDWIFIDWADMDKEGPLAAEQILLWRACASMARIARLVGEDSARYEMRADALKTAIFHRFWCEEKGAFIDSFQSGRKNVTRHASIFAILFDLVDEEKKRLLAERVLQNEMIPPITTPYFKLYELSALCSLGHLEEAQTLLTEYWGGMLAKGATTMWEEFKPDESIPACYAMYGNPFEKSLCHAWSSGPIYFLGRYCLGVQATAPGYVSYTVSPNPGIYTDFDGVVPTERGEIRVSLHDGALSVQSALDGGTLLWKGKTYPIPKGKMLTV